MNDILKNKIDQLKRFASNRIKNFTNLNFRLALFKKKVNSNTNSDTEIYSLVGHGFLWMYLASIFSFKDSFDIDTQITVYDDGTLTERDISILKRKIENVRIIKKEVSENKIKHILEKFPYIKKARDELILMKKIIDCVFLSESKNLILLDCDMIFIKKALKKFNNLLKEGRLIAFKDRKEVPYFSFNGHQLTSKYFRNAYKNHFKKDIKFIKYFNSGFVKFKKEDIDFYQIEKFLEFIENEKDNSIIKYEKWLVEQTCFAYSLSLRGGEVEYFPFELFTVYRPGYKKTIKNAISLHFVRQFRFINFAYLKYFYKYFFSKDP